MKYDVIWEIMRLPSASIVSADGKYSHELINTNIVLSEVPNCLGGKTGFTPLAGRSLLMGVSDPTKEHKIIMVILDDPYRWQDVKIMADWAFRACEWK
jgi:D-alanyl-D-alanine carboxypeptidase